MESILPSSTSTMPRIDIPKFYQAIEEIIPDVSGDGKKQDGFLPLHRRSPTFLCKEQTQHLLFVDSHLRRCFSANFDETGDRFVLDAAVKHEHGHSAPVRSTTSNSIELLLCAAIVGKMGNQVGKGANRMAIAAMSNVTHIEKREIAALLNKFKEMSIREGTLNMVNRTDFTEALTIVGINQNDADILDRLFTMYDKSGDDQINYKDFIVGIAPLISGTHVEKIDFAFRLYDIEGTSYLKGKDMVNVLSQMNRVASYFGDPVMTEEQVTSVITDIQEMAGGAVDGLNDAIHYVEYIKIISDHPVVNTFISGGGSVQYGMGR